MKFYRIKMYPRIETTHHDETEVSIATTPGGSRPAVWGGSFIVSADLKPSLEDPIEFYIPYSSLTLNGTVSYVTDAIDLAGVPVLLVDFLGVGSDPTLDPEFQLYSTPIVMSRRLDPDTDGQ